MIPLAVALRSLISTSGRMVARSYSSRFLGPSAINNSSNFLSDPRNLRYIMDMNGTLQAVIDNKNESINSILQIGMLGTLGIWVFNNVYRNTIPSLDISLPIQVSTPITEDNVILENVKESQQKISTPTATTTTSVPTSSIKYDNSKIGIQNKIIREAKRQGVDPALALAMAEQESGFRPTAVSGAGARGVFQLMPATAKELGVKDINNVDQNIQGGIKYLAQQLKTFKGNERLALAAYNAGPGAVRKYKGIPPYKETQNYVKKIQARKNYWKSQVDKIAGTSIKSAPTKNTPVSSKLSPVKKSWGLYQFDNGKGGKSYATSKFKIGYKPPITKNERYDIPSGGYKKLPDSVIKQYNLVHMEPLGLKTVQNWFRTDYPYVERNFGERLKRFTQEANKYYKIQYTSGFGGNHGSSAHTTWGTAADFSFPDPNNKKLENILINIAMKYGLFIAFHDAGSGYHGHIYLQELTPLTAYTPNTITKSQVTIADNSRQINNNPSDTLTNQSNSNTTLAYTPSTKSIYISDIRYPDAIDMDSLFDSSKRCSFA